MANAPVIWHGSDAKLLPSGNLLKADGTIIGGGGGNAFTTMQPITGTSPTAASATDTLNFASADGTVAIAGNSGTKTLDFSAVNLFTTLGDIAYGGSGGARTRLAGNTTTTKMYLSQTGNGSVSAAPVWAQIAFADLSGSVSAAQLPNPSASTLGGVQSFAAISHQWIRQISTSGVPSASQPDFSDLTGQNSLAQASASHLLALFGDGSDGDLTVSTSSTTSGPLTAGVLTRDAYFHNLTLSGTCQINTAGFMIFVSGTLDISAAPAGAIILNGNNASSTGSANGAAGGSGGAAVGGASLGSGQAGGTGGVGGTTTGTQAASQPALAGNGGAAGQGSQGGTGASGAGGAVRAASTVTAFPVRRIVSHYVKGATLINGGAGAPGGGGGGGDGATGAAGGGGGGGAGILVIYANTIARGTNVTAGIIQAKGGNGTSAQTPSGGTNTAGGGGGGGGGGGWIVIIYGTLTGSTITNALDTSSGAGANGGNGKGTGIGGDGGGSGAGGRITLMNAGTGTISESTGGAGSNSGIAASGTTGGTGHAATTFQVNL